MWSWGCREGTGPLYIGAPEAEPTSGSVPELTLRGLTAVTPRSCKFSSCMVSAGRPGLSESPPPNAGEGGRSHNSLCRGGRCVSCSHTCSPDRAPGDIVTRVRADDSQHGRLSDWLTLL